MARSREMTRERLQACALRLFTERGYAQTSVADIAREAGVSHMTFFRHYPTKESVIVEDPFDPLIAELVRGRPETEPPLVRVVRGLLDALEDPEARRHLDSPEFRQRVVIAGAEPELRAATWAAGERSRAAIADALVATGVPAFEGEAAAGAVMGAATALLLAWALDGSGESPHRLLVDGLTALLPGAWP